MATKDTVSEEDIVFTTAEIRTSLWKMKSYKTPGPDGLPAEFYKVFFDSLKHNLVLIFNEIAAKGVMPTSMNEAVTVLLSKDGDRLEPSNKRPISLLNSDYKLLAKVLNEVHFERVLKENISSEQTCAVRGRSIHDALILTRDVIEYSKKRVGGCLISLDQKKAFDMVNHEFLFKILRRMGVNTKLISIIQAMYKSISTRVQINGHLTEKVNIKRGVRQGCPLSPTLYVIYVQATIDYLKSDYGIEGLKLPLGKVVKVSAYADDLLLFCQQWETQKVFDIFELIRRATGSALNTTKTKVLNLSKTAVLPQYEVDRVKALGVMFSSKGHTVDSEANFSLARTKAIKRMEGWKSLVLTLPGKVLLVNTGIIPLFFHMSGVFLPKSETFKPFRKDIFSFIWGEGKRESVARDIVQTSKVNGGLGLVDLERQCKSMYLYHNMMRPLEPVFNHIRSCLYKYNFSFVIRNL